MILTRYEGRLLVVLQPDHGVQTGLIAAAWGNSEVPPPFSLDDHARAFVDALDTWKIDAMSILPYAETLMRLDRELKGETEEHQVDQLVAKLPSL